MATEKLIILKDIPDIKWTEDYLKPICREHSMELDEGHTDGRGGWQNASGYSDWYIELKCAEGPHIIKLPKSIGDIQDYIRKKLDSRQYTDAKLIDLDGMLVPVSKKQKIETKDGNYFITSQIKNGKRGDQLIIYAGKKGEKDKTKRTQIFVDPEHKKMSFDQNDLSPADLFVKIEATFPDGTKHIIQSGDKK